jgi:multidrug efflux pump
MKKDMVKNKPFLDEIRKQMIGIPGATIEVAQEDAGPPTDPPVNIEVSGDNFDEIAQVATDIINHLDDNPV